MPQREVAFHPAAVEEALAAATWYAERSDSAAVGFLNELDRAVEHIAEAPERWPIYVEGTRRFLLGRFPFSIVYRILGETIQVVAVAHGHRRPGYWKAR